MRFHRLCGIAALVFLSSLLCIGQTKAQAPLEPAQMPARTLFYVIWHGAPAPEVRKTNSLLALWDDPEFAPTRAALLSNFASGSEKDASQQKHNQEQLEQFSVLLENPFVLGYLSKPTSKGTAKSSTSAADNHWNGIFVVYDRTGKEAILSKVVIGLRSREKEQPQISETTIAGIPALKIERKTETTYWVEHGKYAASANDPSVLEEILNRLEHKSNEGGLAQSAAYREAQPLLGGSLEFFLKIPDLKELVPKDAAASGFKAAPAIDALKVDAVHSIAGQVSFEGPKTRVQAGILGDTSPDTLFDLWADGQQSPASLALVPEDAVSYSETQINLPGVYALVKRVMRAVLPPAQQGNADMMEALAQARLGMPLADALDSVSGEFGTMQTSPEMDPQKAIVFIRVRKKPETLKLIRTIFGDQVSAERNEGDTTFLRISLNGGPSKAGVAEWDFYHLAVTPNMILGSHSSEIIRELLARNNQGTAGAGLGALPQFRSARAQFPENLDSLTYMDFTKVNWQQMKEQWMKDAKKAAAKAPQKDAPAKAVDSGSREAKTPGANNLKSLEILSNFNPQVLARHLHFTSGAAWKDAKGIHFDQWLE